MDFERERQDVSVSESNVSRLPSKSRSVFFWFNSGLIMAFDCDTTETRNKLLDIMFHKHKFIALSCGEKSIRFRPNLAVTDTEMEDAMNRTKKSIQDLD